MTVHYKVTDSYMRSYFAIFDAEVQYREGEWTEAPEAYAKRGFHLFVFDTLENAKAFALGAPDAQLSSATWERIWECECEDEVPVPKNYDALYGSLLDMTPIYDHAFLNPKGTKTFKRIKLTRLIQ